VIERRTTRAPLTRRHRHVVRSRASADAARRAPQYLEPKPALTVPMIRRTAWALWCHRIAS